MDNPTTLLVAIMYVTLVSISLGNVLMALASVVGGQARPDGVHLGWVLLLPIVHLMLFWQTTEILDFEGWTFYGFMGFLVGPILLLFATSLLIDLPAADADDRRPHFETLGRRFFALLALFCLWLVLLDVFTGNLILQTYLTVGLGALSLVLASTTQQRVQQGGLVLGWILFIGSVASPS